MVDYLTSSERLGFRQWRDEDYAPFAIMNANEQVMEFFSKKLSPGESNKAVDLFRKHIEDCGFGFFAVDDLRQKKFIGFIGIQHIPFKAAFTPGIEIGWRLDPASWNQGLATEGAKHLLTYAFNQYGFKEILSFTPILNNRSEKVMIKAGMSKIGEFLHPVLPENDPLRRHVLYGLPND
jgi:RimJ/RimL family protein N-acetyltransferase